MKLKAFMPLAVLFAFATTGKAQDWPAFWKNYSSNFMDNQARVIDHDGGDRTTSEGQSYGMFFALVANDRARFDGLLHWTESNLANGNLSANLPAWLWGRAKDNTWGVLDKNSASDADIWIAYSLLEAGRVWNEPRYTKIGTALAHHIASQEVVEIPGLGKMVAPGPTGFQHGDSYRLNSSYVPLQLILRLAQLIPDGPWNEIAAATPKMIAESAPHGFVSDWTEFSAGPTPQVVPTIGSYDAIRVYLWAGMLDKTTKDRDALLNSLYGMANYLRANQMPPAKVRPDGSIEDPKGPVGFSAALIPYAEALQQQQIGSQQAARVQSELKPQTGLLGSPPHYFDQNLALFGLGFSQRKFWFDAHGKLGLNWTTR